MSKFDKYCKIKHENELYSVFNFDYNGENVPVIVDYEMATKLKALKLTWSVNNKGMVVTNYSYFLDGEHSTKELYLHDVILRLFGKNKNIVDDKKCSILHINKLGVDNRKCNLMFDTNDKITSKNIKKKERTITLPKKSGIDPNDLPSFVWYLKSHDTHGDRFVICINDITWKSTSSKKVSLRYKLEETKKCLRYIKNKIPHEFKSLSMNGNLNEKGEILLNSYIDISKTAGYKNINYTYIDNTTKYLKENTNGLSDCEKVLLDVFNPENIRINFNKKNNML